MKPKTQFIEPLEPRIAPAILVNGGNLLGGAGNPSTGETSTGQNTLTLVKVLSGQALVFYNDGVITGISVGNHTKLDITGPVNGDIVTNLGPNGRLTDSDNDPSNGEDGGILLPIGIKGITTHDLNTLPGNIGRIIAGGAIKDINVSGQIDGIYAGDGIFRDNPTATVTTLNVDTNTVLPGFQNTFTFHQNTTTPNGNAGIKNVTINTAAQLEIFAGSGVDTGSGTPISGGNIVNVTIAKTLSAQGSRPVVFLHAGDGGNGADAGGAGGSITSFNDQGSIAYVKLQTGNGGDAANGTGGNAGNLATSTIVSSSSRYDIVMGDGGSGQLGGKGGSIQTVSFTNNIEGNKTLIATGDLNGDGFTDVIEVNTLTGEALVSLGAKPTPLNPALPSFNVATQSVPQADGTVTQTDFLPAEGANPTSLVLADFNGDGHLDFAVSYAATDTVGVFTNHGDGTFSAAQLTFGFSPTRIVAGDFLATGHTDLAIVSSDTGNASALTGASTQVYIDHNDGQGNFTLVSSPVAVINDTVTDAAGALAYTKMVDANQNPVPGTVMGVDLYVGLKSGNIAPILFRGGVATIGTTINAFTGDGVPVDNVDAYASIYGTGSQVLAFSKDINATRIAAGNTTLSTQAQATIFAVDGDAVVSGSHDFEPAGATRARFLAGTTLVGTVAPGAVSIWNYASSADGTNAYTVVGTVGSTGGLRDVDATLNNGLFQIAASGAADNRFFFTNGSPGGAAGLNPFETVQTVFEPRKISFTSGSGGNGDSLAGGAGGTIKDLNYTQTLGDAILQAGGSYVVDLTTGHGGDSNGGVGGKGGDVHKGSLSLEPGYLTFSDDTDTAVFSTGAGGRGTTGGNGGGIKKITETSVFKETQGTGTILGSVALRLLTGNGGVGTTDAGGKGGSILLAGQSAISGVTFVDSDAVNSTEAGLLVKAGDGGAGVTAGGAGGSLTNVGSQNAPIAGGVLNHNELASALLMAGAGGAASAGQGGSGGAITASNVVVAEASLPIYVDDKLQNPLPFVVAGNIFPVKDGWVRVVSGDGGVGKGGTGGAGGTITKSTIGSSTGDPTIDQSTGNVVPGTHTNYGVIIQGGAGGAGDQGGGAGGGIDNLNISSPSNPLLYAAVIASGHGGDALSNGVGGAGGNITTIKQVKDVNSTINAIQAGDGGRGANNAGGVGGSITGVNSVGFLGLPSTVSSAVTLGAFNSLDTGVPTEVSSLFNYSRIPQGIFAGQGAGGAANGNVENIVARQIAAIGATVQANGTFAAANTVDNVTSDLIGYHSYDAANAAGASSGPFQSSDGKSTSPSKDVPIDGFILASTVTNINTVNNGRTAAYTFTN